jgi:hypothetical protein
MRTALPPPAAKAIATVRPASLPASGARSWRAWALDVLPAAAQVVVADAAIALLVTLLHGTPFGPTLLYAQAIGLSMLGFVLLGQRLLLRPGRDRPMHGRRGLAVVIGACVAGYAAGPSIGDAFTGGSTWRHVPTHPLAKGSRSCRRASARPCT